MIFMTQRARFKMATTTQRNPLMEGRMPCLVASSADGMAVSQKAVATKSPGRISQRNLKNLRSFCDRAMAAIAIPLLIDLYLPLSFSVIYRAAAVCWLLATWN